jgi:hypothetical protein
MRPIAPVRILAFAACLGVSTGAAALQTYIHEFALTKQGQVFFDDSFDNGTPPPQAPNLLIAPFNSVSYLVTGSFPAGSEANGRLLLDTSAGAVVMAPGTGVPTLLVRARLLTNSDPASNLGLKDFHTFTVSGIFDTVPVPVGGGYGIALTDPQTPSVSNFLSYGVRDLDGMGPKLGLQYVTPGGSAVIGTEVPIDIGRQIELQLARTSTTSDVVSAWWRYVGSPTFTQIADPAGDAKIFTASNVTQAEFRIFAPVPEPGTYAMLLAGLGLLVLVARRRIA